MPKLAGRETKPFKRLPNATVINHVREDASPTFRERVPEATQANLDMAVDNIFNFQATRNEFINSLVNVGVKIAGGVNFANPLSKYKREAIAYGDRIEHTQLGLAKAYGYSHDRDYMERDLFGREPLESMLAVYRIARQEYYKITIDEMALRRAFYTDFGVSDFITDLMKVPATSDEVDEFEIMVSMYRKLYDRGGYFVVPVGDVSDLDSDAAQARALTRRVRAFASNLRYVSRHYNAARMPVAAKPESLVLITTPEAQAAVDVEALAAAFNIDKAEMPFRTEVIPQDKLNIPGVQAILTTEDFLIVADTLYETRVQGNAVGLYENHYLHHHSIIGINPFVPAILFSSTDEGTVIPTDETPVTGMGPVEVHDLFSITPQTAITEIERSHLYQVTGSAITTPEGGTNDQVRLRLVGTSSPLSYVRQDGGLHIGPDETADSVIVQALALDDNSVNGSVTLTFSDEPVVYAIGGETVAEPDPGDEGGDGGTEAASARGTVKTATATKTTKATEKDK